MQKPNYKDGSIVNLMSSIKKSFGGSSEYKPLAGFNNSKIAGKTIVLIVIDGLGYEFIQKYGRDTFLSKNLKDKITSVFPATTASAMTAFSTGVPSQQHGLTGWFVYLKELGAVTTVLPFRTRAGNLSLAENGINYKDIFSQESFFKELGTPSFYIGSGKYIDSDYSRTAHEGAKRLPFSSLKSFTQQIQKLISDSQRKYVLAYWDGFDMLSHIHGNNSQEVRNHFAMLDKEIKSLSKILKEKNAVLIISADHGFIDTGAQDIVYLENHPRLKETLALPLAGDSRAVYCYVKPGKTKEFEKYMKTVLKNYCHLYQSKDLLEEGFFGLYKPHEKLLDRIGDYTIIMKKSYIMKDEVLGEERHNFIGHHSGMSKEEMFVPLVVIE